MKSLISMLGQNPKSKIQNGYDTSSLVRGYTKRVEETQTDMNDRDDYDLVEAAPAKTLALYAEQLDKLDRDIVAAKASKSPERAAVATEETAQIYLDCGKDKVAAVYLQEAYQLYVQAKITTKVDFLEYTYPQLFNPAPQEPEPERVNYFTDEFIATLSHEFRNPLNGILGMSEALLEEVFGTMAERQLNAVTTIERSGQYLLALINSMVDLSHLQAGKLELAIARVSIAQLCESSANFVKHRAIQKKIQLDFDLPDEAGEIEIDPLRMRQVTIDLLDRAIETTPVGGKVKLAVTLGADRVELAIFDTSKDTSSGEIAASMPQSTASIPQRSGLGLMLVHPIVELHGGTIDFQTIGRGCCVKIALPNTRTSDTAVREPAPMPPTPASIESNDREVPDLPTILIVEDNELNINTISSYLTAKGYRPILAGDGKAAIELTQTSSPDLILMDIQMPGMDGLEAIARIRELGIVDIPIIALTALAMDGDREKCLAVGANDYLTKPVKLRQLHDTIQHFLNAKFDRASLSDDPWN